MEYISNTNRFKTLIVTYIYIYILIPYYRHIVNAVSLQHYLFSDSTITGTDMNNLLILHLESGDSKNYTCRPITEVVEHSKTNKNVYTHYVIGIYHNTVTAVTIL